jgi:ABC-type lipoprotein release transport system permease subunit
METFKERFLRGVKSAPNIPVCLAFIAVMVVRLVRPRQMDSALDCLVIGLYVLGILLGVAALIRGLYLMAKQKRNNQQKSS